MRDRALKRCEIEQQRNVRQMKKKCETKRQRDKRKKENNKVI